MDREQQPVDRGRRGGGAGHPDEQERQRIEEIAKDLFLREGYDTVRVGQIAEAAGIPEIAVYRAYRSKQGLLDAALWQPMARLRDRLLPLDGEGRTFEDGLRVLDTVVDLFLDRPEDALFLFYYLNAVDSGMRRPAVAHPEQEVYDLLGHAFGDAEDRGVIRARPPERLWLVIELVLAYPVLMAEAGPGLRPPDPVSSEERRAACRARVRERVCAELRPE